MTQNAKDILEKLTELYAQRDLLHIAHDEARDAVIPEEVEAALADVDAEFTPKLDAIDQKIASLEEDAKAAVLSEGATVKGNVLQAVYTKGRVSWDNKKLEGLMMIVPQLEGARSVGQPTVSIRKIGK